MAINGSKYDPLFNFLKMNNSEKIILSFDEIREILGFSLPQSAFKYHAWWDGSSQHTQSYSWTEAGFKARPILKEKKVEIGRAHV